MSDSYDDYESKMQLAEHAWEQALEEKQEPVAWQGIHDTTDLYWRKPVQGDVRPLYTRPQPAAQWVGLTDEEREFLLHQALKFYDTNAQLLSFIKTVEAKLKEKNT